MQITRSLSITTSATMNTAECESSSSSSSKYSGFVDKRYIGTFHGIIHGLGSTIALVLGNLIFINRVLLGSQSHGSSTTYKIFHACNFIASATTALFFWNKVQSWQLSTMTMEEKGVTARTAQRFNQGRGVVCMLSYSLVPFACHVVPFWFLQSRIFSSGLALAMIALSAVCYNLIKDYGKKLWLIYGMTPMAVGFTILCNSEQTLVSVYQNTPLVIDRFKKEASFVISCVQFGFMMYYLYSRNLVTKKTVQKACKTYHSTVATIYVIRVMHDLLTYFIETPTSIIPWPMLVQPILLSMVFSLKLLKPLVVATKGTKKEAKEQSQPPKSPPTPTEAIPLIVEESPSATEPLLRKSRRLSARRRSSLAKRIEYSCSVCR
jgi:hypothetical protein